MTPGVYALVSALTARTKQQELLANNISSATSIGHRRELTGFANFDQVLRQTQGTEASARKLPVPLPYAQPTAYDMNSGELKNTGRPTDVAIVGEGFFTIQTAAGVRLTRNGHFTVNSDGRLVTDGGSLVLGESGPITLPQGQTQIRDDGRVEVDGVEAARLRVVRPKALEQLRAEGGSIFSVGGTPLEDLPAPTLAQGTVEMSNVNLPQELVRVINNQRMYDMLTRAVQTQDENMGRAIQNLSEI